jgi:glutamate dehydrogenase
LKSPMKTVYKKSNSFVIGSGKERRLNAISGLTSVGVPEGLARKMAELLLTRGGLDIADLAVKYKKDVIETAKMYSLVSERLGIVWLHQAVESLAVDGRWQAMARGNLRDEFYAVRRSLATLLLKRRSRLTPSEQFHRWTEKNAASVGKFDQILREMRLREDIDFATLSVAAQELRKFIAD